MSRYVLDTSAVLTVLNDEEGILLGAELVHKDPEYDTVPDLETLQLPYKP